MTTTETHDVVVVGGGTGGCFAAATVADHGLDVVLLERKSQDEAGHIACGDAIKGDHAFPDGPIDIDRVRDKSYTNPNITRGVFEDPQSGERISVEFDGYRGAVMDRKRYGEVILDEAERAGTEIHYDTVVTDVTQTDDGRVTGVETIRKGEATTYEATVVVDAAGSLSLLQDKADLAEATFDTDVNYQHFCAAYREVIDVPRGVDYDDAIVFKPTDELGYLWYFPRSSTRINAGLGFQMSEPPMELVEVLREDMRGRAEFAGAEVVDKLGAAVPTRRPYDSAVAPGYVAVGDAAGHVNPVTGGGIPGAAKGAAWAAERAVEAVTTGDPTEETLWDYNRRVQTGFGKSFAAIDLYNIWGTAHGVFDLVDIVTSIPAQQLIDLLGSSGTLSLSPGMVVKLLAGTVGHWSTLYDLYRLNGLAEDLRGVYDAYPHTPAGFDRWQRRRDAVMDQVYDLTGADPKY